MNRGMTLVEVMIALSMIAIASVALLSAFTTSTMLSDSTDQANAVANAIQEKLTEVRADAREDYDAMIDDYTRNTACINFDIIGPDGELLTRNPDSGFGSTGHITLTPLVDETSPSPVMKVRVSVRAAWLGPTGEEEMSRQLTLARR
jgi:prepilin-type N-terminal cleavage/methylation domain-containing protein